MASVISVSELNERAKTVLASESSINDVWVSGEISNLTRHSSGHYYFTLKDQRSEVRCTLFRGARNSLQFEPAESLKVTAFGSVDMYVARGSYQFNVMTMRRSGIGDMYLALEELKKKLRAEGLFDESRKRKLPRYPMTVGVVTSPTGAVIHDIIRVAEKRFPVNIILVPVLVQGEGAAQSISKGIELMNTQNADIMIVGRGGGSAEDLWAFNEESVARAIAASRIPVISAVGHETDFTIADMVADVRAPTPSAAAEMALPDVSSEARNIDGMMMRASRSLAACISLMNSRFVALDSKLSLKRAKEAVISESKNVNELSRRASVSVRSIMNEKNGMFRMADAKLSPRRAKDRIEQLFMELDDASAAADRSVAQMIAGRRKDMISADQRLRAVNPMNVLERGYSFVKGPDGATLVSVHQISPGSDVEITMKDGIANAKIKEVIRK
ncbi:MAG: exodeoxyribonuclease VII large subunit [Methanomassiliicoccaceae archaeon]|jgi:exodeoxyribonuclease VII large subunit|nr:exodeoxyribonuclease VII large subunit [Methanomassiliicoccaceae archaeon]